jgi:hypothetical protein
MEAQMHDQSAILKLLENVYGRILSRDNYGNSSENHSKGTSKIRFRPLLPHLIRGKILLLLGQYHEAAENFRMALRLD